MDGMNNGTGAPAPTEPAMGMPAATDPMAPVTTPDPMGGVTPTPGAPTEPAMPGMGMPEPTPAPTPGAPVEPTATTEGVEAPAATPAEPAAV